MIRSLIGRSVYETKLQGLFEKKLDRVFKASLSHGSHHIVLDNYLSALTLLREDALLVKEAAASGDGSEQTEEILEQLQNLIEWTEC